jgi:hypothetical protein
MSNFLDKLIGESVEEKLLEEETVLYRVNKHWIVFFQPFLWLCISFLFLFEVPIFKKMALVTLALTLITGGLALINFYLSEMLLTSIRLLARLGFFRKIYLDIFLWDIKTIDVKQGMWGKLFNYGQVEICDVQGKCIAITYIARPHNLKGQFEKEIDSFSEDFLKERTELIQKHEKEKKKSTIIRA